MSPTTAGYRIYVPQEERDEWDQRRKDGRRRADDFHYGAEHLFPAKWDPIFSDEEWKSIISFLTKPERTNPGRAPKSLLSGLLYCYRCGSVLGYSTTAKFPPSYKCSNDSLVCPGIGISAKPIEEYVEGIVRATIEGSPGFVVGSPKVRSLPKYDARDKLRAQEKKWLDLYGEDVIPRAELLERLGEVRQQLDRLNKEEGRQLEDIARAYELNDSLSRWDSLEMAERRAVLKARFRRITILPTQRIWGRNFQPLRVVPWWSDGDEPSIEEALAALQEAEREQVASLNQRAVAAADRQARRPKGGSK